MKVKKIKDKVMSIWNHTEMEMDDLSKAGIKKHIDKISDIVNELIGDIEELKTCSVCSFEVCDTCVDGMEQQYGE